MTARIDARIRGVTTRIDGFARQIEAYSSKTMLARVGPIRALELIAAYVPWLRNRLEDEVAGSTDDRSLLSFLQTVVLDLFHASDFVDEWFSESTVQGVPLPLFEGVERECELLGVGPRKAVLAVGPSHEFHTAAHELSSLIFRGVAAGAEPDGLPDTRFAMIRIPRVEANSSLWWPAVLGHEVAHIKARFTAPLEHFFLPDRAEFQVLAVPPDRRTQTVLIAHAWIVELLCDAYAVRRFGPSAISAVVEVLDHRGAVEKYSETHPPAWLRASVMCRWIDRLGFRGDVYAPLLNHALDIATSAQPTANPPFDILSSVVPVLLGMADEYMDFVQSWSATGYDAPSRHGRVQDAARDLDNGIPPRLERLADDPTAIDADIANAAWAAVLSNSLWPTERLATKAMHDLGFLRRWLKHGGVVDELRLVGATSPSAPVVEAPLPSGVEAAAPAPAEGAAPHTDGMSAAGAVTARSGAALSGEAISARLCADWTDSRKLVATPLLGKPVGDASVDIRLGNKFIVFERTETPSIRTLDREVHGRRVQRQVEVGWGRRFILHPQELVLASTLEYIVLPGDLAAQVVTRSSYGRMGLICATAVQVHPHYRGCLTLELLNLGVAPLEIAPGERIAQLIFWEILPPIPMPAEPDRTCPTGAEFSRPIRDHGDDRVLADMLAEADSDAHAAADQHAEVASTEPGEPERTPDPPSNNE